MILFILGSTLVALTMAVGLILLDVRGVWLLVGGVVIGDVLSYADLLEGKHGTLNGGASYWQQRAAHRLSDSGVLLEIAKMKGDMTC